MSGYGTARSVAVWQARIGLSGRVPLWRVTAWIGEEVMDKQQIVRNMTSRYGDFVTVNETAQYLRVDRGTARGLLNGLPYLPIGRKKLFNVADVAQRIKEKERI